MNLTSRHPRVLAAALLLAVVSPLPAAESASAAEVKRVTDRYALTKTRISALLDQRLHPTPLPANPANPFYLAPKEAAGDPVNPGGESPETPVIPESADLSDIDTIRKYAATLKIGGVLTFSGLLHVTINNTASKVGDTITVGHKDRPIYLRIVGLTPNELTLGLNDAMLTVSLKK